MPRIRTIKPDFWTDEAITECSLSARLMFIGMLNFADDNGNIERSSKQIKMRVFPADVIDCEELLIDLITHGLLTEYSVNGKKYLHINGFSKHQVINRPSKSSIPQPDSLTNHGGLNEDSMTEGKGKEGKGREEEGNRSKTSLAQYLSACEQQDIEPIPEDSVVFENARKLDLTTEFALVAWSHFKEHWINKSRSTKSDWVATFNNCLKDDGYGAYRKNSSGEWYLTTKGKNTLTLMNQVTEAET